MKIFVDSANLEEIEESFKRGFPSGVTTNPSILAREEKCDFKEHIRKIIDVIRKYGPDRPLSVEVFTVDPKEMVAQAESFVEEFSDYSELYIKVPIGWDELWVIHQLRQKGIKINCTCCMSYNQAVMAALAGSNFVSLFVGRIRDSGYDAFEIVKQTKDTFREGAVPSEIIVGSIRHIMDVNQAFQAGADIVTVPPKFFPQLVKNLKTDEVVHQFVTDFANWLR
ncbi:MAG: transaldolase family protein [bacterium]|nr:transaldolase family protein [bacterium]